MCRKSLYFEVGGFIFVLHRVQNHVFMLRCKTPIHATEPVLEPEGNPDFANGTFTFQMDAPVVPSTGASDWSRLRGDLLFTVYDSSQGRNSFVGQVLLPLRKLVDGTTAVGVHGGKQRVLSQEFRPGVRNQQCSARSSQPWVGSQE